MAGDGLPSGWRLVKLGEIGEVNRGRSRHRPRYAEHLYGGPYPFIQTGDIKNSGGQITSYQQTYSEAGLAQSRMRPTSLKPESSHSRLAFQTPLSGSSLRSQSATSASSSIHSDIYASRFSMRPRVAFRTTSTWRRLTGSGFRYPRSPNNMPSLTSSARWTTRSS